MAWVDAMIQQCAPDVGFGTMKAIVMVESGGHPWAIGDNTTKKSVKPTPRSYEEAVAKVQELLNQGHNIDIGLAMINSKNLAWLGLSVEQVLDPCINLRAGAYILKGNYEKASMQYGPGEKALLHALSQYNSGSMFAAPSYVQKILSASGAWGTSWESTYRSIWGSTQVSYKQDKYRPRAKNTTLAQSSPMIVLSKTQ